MSRQHNRVRRCMSSSTDLACYCVVKHAQQRDPERRWRPVVAGSRFRNNIQLKTPGSGSGEPFRFRTEPLTLVSSVYKDGRGRRSIDVTLEQATRDFLLDLDEVLQRLVSRRLPNHRYFPVLHGNLDSTKTWTLRIPETPRSRRINLGITHRGHPADLSVLTLGTGIRATIAVPSLWVLDPGHADTGEARVGALLTLRHVETLVRCSQRDL